MKKHASLKLPITERENEKMSLWNTIQKKKTSKTRHTISKRQTSWRTPLHIRAASTCGSMWRENYLEEEAAVPLMRELCWHGRLYNDNVYSMWRNIERKKRIMVERRNKMKWRKSMSPKRIEKGIEEEETVSVSNLTYIYYEEAILWQHGRASVASL